MASQTELSNTELLILSQLGKIKHGKPGRPSHRRLQLIAQIAAVDAYLNLKQIKDETTNEKPETVEQF